jgi:hypothetical protein
MRELPIIFSTEMVRAIRENRKTQTRRLSGLEIINKNPDIWLYCKELSIEGVFNFYCKDCLCYDIKSKYKKGDRLYIRESFTKVNNKIIYKADIPDEECKNYKWKPAIHIQKKDCRKWLEVVDVYPERLQDISKNDAIQEGIRIVDKYYGKVWYKDYISHGSFDETASDDPIYSFSTLWDSINAKRGYPFEGNFWVWVIKFKRIN